MGRKRVLVAMSGGTDSSAACMLLQEQGYEIEGITMRMWEKPSERGMEEPPYIREARLLAEVIKSAFKEENESYGNQQLRGQLEAFQRVLIHDLDPEGFADIYAQTIAYGMFAARLHDPTPEMFSRQEAAALIPKTNPFLRRFFQHLAGADLDGRVTWIVDDLAAAIERMKEIGIEPEGEPIYFAP